MACQENAYQWQHHRNRNGEKYFFFYILLSLLLFRKLLRIRWFDRNLGIEKESISKKIETSPL